MAYELKECVMFKVNAKTQTINQGLDKIIRKYTSPIGEIKRLPSEKGTRLYSCAGKEMKISTDGNKLLIEQEHSTPHCVDSWFVSAVSREYKDGGKVNVTRIEDFDTLKNYDINKIIAKTKLGKGKVATEVKYNTWPLGDITQKDYNQLKRKDNAEKFKDSVNNFIHEFIG